MITHPAFPKELGFAAVLAHRKELAPDVVANIQRTFSPRPDQAPTAVKAPVATIPEQREPQTHRESMALPGSRPTETILPDFSQEQVKRTSIARYAAQRVLQKLGIKR